MFDSNSILLHLYTIWTLQARLLTPNISPILEWDLVGGVFVSPVKCWLTFKPIPLIRTMDWLRLVTHTAPTLDRGESFIQTSPTQSHSDKTHFTQFTPKLMMVSPCRVTLIYIKINMYQGASFHICRYAIAYHLRLQILIYFELACVMLNSVLFHHFYSIGFFPWILYSYLRNILSEGLDIDYFPHHGMSFCWRHRSICKQC